MINYGPFGIPYAGRAPGLCPTTKVTFMD